MTQFTLCITTPSQSISSTYMKLFAALLLQIIVVLDMTGCSSSSNRSTIHTTYRARLLWDSHTSNIAEGLLINEPSDMIIGPLGELIIADTGNSRIVRISCDAEVIEIIGKRGSGPGEFMKPQDLAFDIGTSTLWIVDRINRLVSRYHIDGNKSTYKDQFKAPSIGNDSEPGIVINNDHAFWICPRGADQRINLVNDKGNTVMAFGEIWIPDKTDNKRLTPIYNINIIKAVNTTTLAVIWQARPYIEIWSRNGTLIRDLQIDTKHIRKLRSYITKEPESVPIYIWSACSDMSAERIYILIWPEEKTYYMYGIDGNTLEINEVAEIEGDNNLVLFNLTIKNDGNGRRYYAISHYDGAVVELVRQGDDEVIGEPVYTQKGEMR